MHSAVCKYLGVEKLQQEKPQNTIWLVAAILLLLSGMKLVSACKYVCLKKYIYPWLPWCPRNRHPPTQSNSLHVMHYLSASLGIRRLDKHSISTLTFCSCQINPSLLDSAVLAQWIFHASDPLFKILLCTLRFISMSYDRFHLGSFPPPRTGSQPAFQFTLAGNFKQYCWRGGWVGVLGLLYCCGREIQLKLNSPHPTPNCCVFNVFSVLLKDFWTPTSIY